jgi:hypothetical protein
LPSCRVSWLSSTGQGADCAVPVVEPFIESADAWLVAVDEVRLTFDDERAARVLFENGRDETLAASPTELAHAWLAAHI